MQTFRIYRIFYPNEKGSVVFQFLKANKGGGSWLLVAICYISAKTMQASKQVSLQKYLGMHACLFSLPRATYHGTAGAIERLGDTHMRKMLWTLLRL